MQNNVLKYQTAAMVSHTNQSEQTWALMIQFCHVCQL